MAAVDRSSQFLGKQFPFAWPKCAGLPVPEEEVKRGISRK